MNSCLKLAFLTIAITFTSAPTHAATVYCTNCSDRVTQALEKATGLEQLQALFKQLNEEVVQTQQQIQMVTQNIQQYENMIKNSIKLPMDIYKTIEGEYKRLNSLYKQVSSLSGDIEGVRATYNNIYPAFGSILSTYDQTWGAMSNQVDKSNQALMEVTGVQLDDLLNDRSGLSSQVEGLLSTPEGRMEAIQAGNQLTAIQVQEARELRLLMATSLQQQAAAAAKQEKIDQAIKEQQALVMPTGRRINSLQAGPE